ncbi:MAG: stage 0 sporulation family protein [Clostridiales bacterium]|nr:stage 0 sporulation family protein [Clostridiales bacterium]
MINVVGVRFPGSGREYYFDPAGRPYLKGEEVIVETARGMEFGVITMTETAVPEEQIVKPLRKVLRSADMKDRARYEENKARREQALVQCQEKVDARGLDMKLVDVEYTFDRSKIIFYFTADGRVDFRDLVKDLASVFKTRIELRQIGVRDEAKLMGGIGNCGRGLCCREWMPDFQPVSIKMAKTQNLSLNPTKISGMCGRLMCCLKFENDIYQELGKGMPGIGERIETPEGLAVVMDVNILVDKIKCRLIQTETNAEGEEYEKLDSEILVYGKEDISRLDKRRGKGLQNGPKKQQNAKKKTADSGDSDGAKSSGKDRERSGRNRPRRHKDENKDRGEQQSTRQEGTPSGERTQTAGAAGSTDAPRKRRRHRSRRRKPQEGRTPENGE